MSIYLFIGGLDDHKRFVVGEAQEVLKKQKFSDLVFISEDGQIAHCNLSLGMLILFNS